MISGLQVLEPRGDHGAHLLDNARVRTVHPRGQERAERASAWVAIEHRPAGAIVWRPSAARVEGDLGELDPLGWEGLRTRLGGRESELVQGRDAFQSKGLRPVLAAAGFESVEHLKAAAREECARELGELTGSSAWARTQAAIEGAISDERLAVAMDADWRRLARGWADAIEALTVEAIAGTREVVVRMERVPALPAEIEQKLRALTGPTWDVIRRCSKNEKDFNSLREKLKADEESTGHRLATLGLAAAEDRRVRQSLLNADAELCQAYGKSSGLFHMLDAAREERNAISHQRTRAEDIDVAALRARTFALARALMGCGLIE
jgi:hypothetical protein